MEAETADSAAASAPEPIALLEIGDATIALPSAVVREVIGWPKQITPASTSHGALLGYFPLRDAAIPLFDLPTVLSLREESGGAMVVIVDLGAGQVGLAIDAAKGFSTLAADRVAGVSRREGAEGGPRYKLFNDPDTGQVTIYLDKELLLELPGMAVASNAAAKHNQEHSAATKSTDRSTGACDMLGFKLRDLSLAIDVTHVREIVTAPPFEKLRLMFDVFLGQARIRNEDVAVIDVDVLLKRPKGPEIAPPIVLLLNVNGRRFGIPATQVTELLDLASVTRAGFPQGAASGDVVRSAVVTKGGEQALELNATAIAYHPEVGALAKKLNAIVDRAAAAQAANADQAVATRESIDAGDRLSGYIKMNAGGPVYADLRNLLQLLEIDSNELLLKEMRDDLAGFITHRGEVVPVLDLPRHLGAKPALSGPASSGGRVRIALAKSDEGTVGMIVDAFDSIEHLSLNRDNRHLRHQADLEEISAACKPAVSYLTALDRTGSKTIKFLDVGALAQSFAEFRPYAA